MRLAASVYVADFGERAVLLDVAANRYRMVGARLSRALADLAAGRAAADEEAIAMLVRAGLIEEREPEGAALAHAMPALDSALECKAAFGAAITGAATLAATVEAVTRLRWTRFPSVLAWAARGKQKRKSAVDGPQRLIAAEAQSFDRLRARIPLRRICLRDSLALFSLLNRTGYDCQLVFGVRLDPFAAHCWVQSGATLLSDHLDPVRQMRPILTL